MFFQLTEDQKMMQKMVREFAEKRVAPEVAKRDEECLFDRSIMDEIGEMGLNGLCFPEKYGGADSDYLSYILAVEELSKVDDGIGVSLSVNVSLCAWPIYAYGTEEQKEKYLRPILEGKHMGAFGLTEPNAGTDAAAQQSVAVLNGDHYILNGSKIFITNAGEAETYVVFAMTDKAKGVKGIIAFIVEKDTPGFTFTKQEEKLGMRATVQRTMVFENCRIPRESLLGREGEGFKIAMSTLDGGRVGIAAQAVGIATGAYEYALAYSKERMQFGQPICRQQAVAFKLASMATQIEAARWMTLHAAWLKDAGRPYTKEAAMAKLFASDTAMMVTTEAVQILGGQGLLRDHPVERMFRDAKYTQIYEGTNEIQKLVISGILLK